MSEGDHGFDIGGIGRWSEPIDFAVTRHRTCSYASATNDEIPQHAEGVLAPPVFAVVPVFSLLADTTMAVVPDELMPRILHGGQDFRFHRPIRPPEVLTSRAKVVGIRGRSSGVLVTTLAQTRDAAGDLVNEQYLVGFFRGGYWDDSAGSEPPPHGFDESLREREADGVITQTFDADQTFRYADASGDPMPIHLDEEFARAMGLPGIIIHGLCTMAFISHAVIGQACPEDPSRLKRLAVRLSHPVEPRQSITTRLWRTEPHRFLFETTNDHDKVVVRDGLAEIAGPAV